MDGYMQNNDLDTISSSNNNFNDNNVIGEILEKEVQWEYAKRALGAIGALGEASKVFDQLITQIQEVINQIQTIYEATQYNKRVCDLLMDRVECLEISLRTLKRNKEDFSKSFLQQHYYDNFLRLINNLNKIKKFISDISLLNGLRKYNHNFYEIKNQFKDIVSEFERVVDQLGFNLGYLLDEQHRKDSDALNEEIDELKKFLDMVGGGITGKDKNINLIFETMTKDLSPKIANFGFAKPTKYSRYVVQDITAVVHWLAPEKLRQSKKAKFSHKSWQDDPCLRPGLYQVFLKLYDLLQKYQNEHPNEVSADISQKLIIKEGGPKTIDDDSSMNVDVIDDKKIDFHDPDLDVSSNLAHRACVFINSNDNQVINNGSHHSFMKPPFPPKINIKDLFIRHKSQKTKITSASTTTSLDDKSISSLRSPNAFILYRTMFFQTARSQGYQLPMTVVSAMASKFWKQEPKYVQDEYKRIAKEAKKFRDELIPSNKINRRNKKKDATFAPNTFSNFDYYLDMMNDREYPSPDLSTGNDNFVNTNESTTTTFDQDPDLNIFGLQYLNF
ncbi:4639_t:CDS:2 [Entrophospora sp. SA101]|nr:4639_t:CDS:2 [Entrophospora sp. SA101]